MDHGKTARRWMIAGLALCAAAGVAAARNGVGLQKALDRTVSLSKSDALIGDVFDALSEETGAAFVIDETALACLPYGEQTRMSVTLKNITLREALTPMLAPQALRWTPDDGTIRILPTEGLARMARRASYDELQTLGKIHSARLDRTKEAGSVIVQLRKLTGNEDLSIDYRVGDDPSAAAVAAERALPGTAAEWLDMLGRGRGWTWYLWYDDIVILPADEQIERQLQQSVTVEYRNADLVDAMLDLADKARVKLSMEPGVLNYLPAETRESFNLVMAEATVAQALEVISGATGLEFVRTTDGIRVEPSEALRLSDQGGRRSRPPFFVRFAMPGPDGTTIEVFMRGDELGEEFVRRIEARKAELIEKVGGSPTTQPAGSD